MLTAPMSRRIPHFPGRQAMPLSATVNLTALMCENLFPDSFSHIAMLSYGERATGNTIIQGENLHVLNALQAHYADQVRCVYIDPPYNNQERYRYYQDSRAHEVWLDMMVTRFHAIKPLLSLDGSIWISIDDREHHYLKVAADEVFGRENFVTTIVWQQRTTRENRKVFSNNHEYLLVYAIDQREFRVKRNSASRWSGIACPLQKSGLGSSGRLGNRYRPMFRLGTVLRPSFTILWHRTVLCIVLLKDGAGYTQKTRCNKKLQRATFGLERPVGVYRGLSDSWNLPKSD